MLPRRKTRGFTLIELLVVVAIIALLLSILLPSLTAAREQGKRAKCLAALKGLSTGMQTYSTEDKSETILPQHPILGDLANGSTGLTAGDMYWQMRMINWYNWGGRSSIKTLNGGRAGTGQPGMSTLGWFSREPLPGGTPGGGPFSIAPFVAQSAETRPLNRYILSGGVGQADARKMDWFKCPSDSGFPNGAQVDDFPQSAFNNPLHEMIGNSYRYSLIGNLDTGAGLWHFTTGPGGKKITSIRDTGKVVAFGEPRFFNMTGRDAAPNPAGEPTYDIPGWHARRLYDNLVFCDGSARYTKAEKREISDQQVIELRIDTQRRGLFARAATYSLGTYPTPGSAYVGTVERAAAALSATPNRWPWVAGRAGN